MKTNNSDSDEAHIRELTHKVFSLLINDQAVDAEDLLAVKEHLECDSYDVCLIGTSKETLIMKILLSANQPFRPYIIDIDACANWRDIIRKEKQFNAVVITQDAPVEEIINLIDECEHFQGVPVLVNTPWWGNCKRTDRLMYSCEHRLAIRTILELYCKASLVSKYIQLPFDLKEHTVLITDDVMLNIVLAKKMLEKDEYIIETAKNNDGTIKILENITPSLVITDIYRIDGSGYELLERIRSKKRYEHLSVMCLSASMNYEPNIREAINKGFTATLCKPIPSTEMLRAMTQQLVMLNDYISLYDMVVETPYL